MGHSPHSSRNKASLIGHSPNQLVSFASWIGDSHLQSIRGPNDEWGIRPIHLVTKGPERSGLGIRPVLHSRLVRGLMMLRIIIGHSQIRCFATNTLRTGQQEWIGQWPIHSVSRDQASSLPSAMIGGLEKGVEQCKQVQGEDW